MGSGSNTQPGRDQLTLLLKRVNAAEPGASDALADAIYGELRAMAGGHLHRDFGPNLAGITIQPTMLASDTFMKLLRQRQKYDNSGHFFAIASRLMMRVLLDYHRARKAQKRGGAVVHVSLEPEHHARATEERINADDDLDVEALDQALARLEALDARKADVVRYRVLWGLTNTEIGKALGVGLATVERDWAFAKVWLSKELKASASPGD
jgi:RNA polymerase sigma factor (TIGR02999 family)